MPRPDSLSLMRRSFRSCCCCRFSLPCDLPPTSSMLQSLYVYVGNCGPHSRDCHLICSIAFTFDSFIYRQQYQPVTSYSLVAYYNTLPPRWSNCFMKMHTFFPRQDCKNEALNKQIEFSCKARQSCSYNISRAASCASKYIYLRIAMTRQSHNSAPLPLSEKKKKKKQEPRELCAQANPEEELRTEKREKKKRRRRLRGISN